MKNLPLILGFILIANFSQAQWITNSGFEKTVNSVEVAGRNYYLGTNTGADGVRVEIGINRSANGPAFFDLTGDVSNYPDFGIRLIRWGDGRTFFTHKGNKLFAFFCPEGAETAFSSGGTRTLTLTSDNKVGIGTSVPTKELAVNGAIQSEEIEVVQDVADYVFEPNYEILPLEELKEYIKDNGHLPNIQTQKDVDENGGAVKLGELTISLMEKVEELTLHIIELNERIKDLESSNKN